MTNDDLISRQDALRAIRHWLLYEKSTKTPYGVLSELPSAQPVDKDIHVPCTDTISRAAALDALRGLYINNPKINNDYAYDTALDRAHDVIKALPSAHPDLSEYSDKLWRSAYERGKAEAQAEIIRCEDCKWKQGAECVRFAEIRVFPNDFCSRSERRTDE